MIYVIDTIGTESGMPKYDEMFYNEFKAQNVEIKVLSNYRSGFCEPLITNFYHSGKVGNILKLIQSYLRLLCFYWIHRKDVFVYQSFGLRFIDIIFISIFLFSKRTFVLVHDVFEITNQDKKYEGKKFRLQQWVYKHCINNIICHSQIAVDMIKEKTQFHGNLILFPHFPYRFDTSYELSNIPIEVKESIDKQKTNYLMFGQLRESKGVDYIIDAMQYLKDNENINVIIAGSDKGKLLNGWDVPSNVKLVTRYITEEEENYLFCNSDVILIPYKEVYQSGVMETIVNFRKPAILSDIRAFREFCEEYPSFGKIFRPKTGKGLADMMAEYISETKEYDIKDIKKYYSNHDTAILINDINKIIQRYDNH